MKGSRFIGQLAPAAFSFAAATALAGGYWDDAWHTERGRDTFFIAPHIAIYLGIAVAGLALAAALASRTRDRRTDVLLRIGLLTLIGALLSGPLDNAWHEAFGRDSVLWSPPHMLGIVGSLGLAYIMLLHLSTTPQHHRVLGAATAGLVVAAAAFSVAEYETDVPQFAPVWYPIVLAFAATVALRLITNTTTARWAATNAAAVQSVFVAVTGALLLGLGYDAPWFSLMLAPGLAIDLGVRRRWGYARCAGAITLAVVLVVMPLREIAGGVGLTASDIGPAAAGVYVTSLLALWLADGAPRRRGRPADRGHRTRPAAAGSRVRPRPRTGQPRGHRRVASPDNPSRRDSHRSRRRVVRTDAGPSGRPARGTAHSGLGPARGLPPNRSPEPGPRRALVPLPGDRCSRRTDRELGPRHGGDIEDLRAAAAVRLLPANARARFHDQTRSRPAAVLPGRRLPRAPRSRRAGPATDNLSQAGVTSVGTSPWSISR
ncbi:hypothetical protein [Conexibacter sp. W3-3-2]|uniref:hypothetical protein n=1 Tax=Conexibacter sp. W3-3-2 TaxID=2675227 RepID=UPI0018A88A4A|nr:hypothetical protein [Conexibacter sp. W3-3-2]